VLKFFPILLGVFAKCPTSYIRLVIIAYYCCSRIVCFFTGIIPHGHGNVKYAHYGLDFYPSDVIHTVGSFAKLLRNLKKPPIYSSRALFDGCGTIPLYEMVLAGREVCMLSLPEPSGELICTKPLPSTLHI
jgi:hypothetical protein